MRGSVAALVRKRPRTRATILRTVTPLIISVFVLVFAPGIDFGNAEPQIPKSLDSLIRNYPVQTSTALRALKRGIEDFEAGRYSSALEELSTGVPPGSNEVEDYALLYRAKAQLLTGQPVQAVQTIDLLQRQYPNSSQLNEAILAKCEALLAQGNPKEALAVLGNSSLEQGSEILYFQGRILEEMGNREEAAALYLRVFADYVNSRSAAEAEKKLRAISPNYQTSKGNYKALLQRSQNLVRAGRNQDALSLLKKLVPTRSPDAAAGEKRALLYAEASLNLGKTAGVLSLLAKISKSDPALHAHSLYLRAVCCRKLRREQEFLAIKETALRIYPNSPATEKILYSVATHYDVENDIVRAHEAYRAIAERFPRGEFGERAAWKVAVLSYFQRQHEEALKGFWHYLRTYPGISSTACAYWMGRSYEALGDSPKAASLYRHVQRLSNHGYYGQRALEAEAGLKQTNTASIRTYAGIDFGEVDKTLGLLRLAPVVIPEPSPAVAFFMERARQLATADLPNLAIAELRRAAAKFPGETTLSYLLSRLYASKEDYYSVIATLRRAFPDYDARPLTGLPDEVWELLFPIRYWQLISTQAAKNKVDPNLILGIIRQESAFDETAHSRANARGLMQVLPSTGRALARQIGVRRYSMGKLLAPDTNIALGARYLAHLLEQFDHSEELALAAYNAGDNRVESWIRNFGKLDMAEFVERIPFGETRVYIKQVLTNRAYYHLLTQAPGGSED